MYHLIGEIKCLNNYILRKLSADEVLNAQQNLSGAKGYIIGFIVKQIEKGEVVYQKDIEKAFSLRRSSATQILNSLEQNGLISRLSEENDKRLKRIIVTQKGLNCHKTIVGRLEDIDKELIAKLSTEELETFKNIVKKLKEGLQVD